MKVFIFTIGKLTILVSRGFFVVGYRAVISRGDGRTDVTFQDKTEREADAH